MLISRPLQSKTFSHRYLAGVCTILIMVLFHSGTYCFHHLCWFVDEQEQQLLHSDCRVKQEVEHKDIDFNIVTDTYFCAFVFPCFRQGCWGLGLGCVFDYLQYLGSSFAFLDLKCTISFFLNQTLNPFMCYKHFPEHGLCARHSIFSYVYIAWFSLICI